MQDEERYMTLNVQSQKRNSIQTPQLKSKDYSVILTWYKIVLGLSGTANCILALTLLILILLVSQGVLLKCQKGNVIQHDEFGEQKVKSEAGGNTGLCQSNWLKYQEKCYWFSSELKSWKDSYEYCLERQSHLLIIQNQLEMDFIQKSLRQSNYVWIGLNFTSSKRTWTWVNGSPLDPKLFLLKGPGKENNCAATYKNKIYSESCSSIFKWICQY
ncbi:killer cell lectin-like receptor subfamily F member 1 [Dasypus novemcinctus]|uniref:killer cell lectin-like receptor subfamily F member 1 n=1 Tax=Dasypus novemcinctus TaxID=9361 RepID=UPI00265FE986|nr:killer cell lectin-like receptor subfamily F member 1 [Dasypus novemcinctus]